MWITQDPNPARAGVAAECRAVTEGQADRWNVVVFGESVIV